MSPKGTRTQDSCTDVWVEISAATILETLDSEKRTIHAASSATLNCHYLTACFTTGLGAAGLPRLRERNSEFSRRAADDDVEHPAVAHRRRRRRMLIMFSKHRAE